jgi:hypothetical protein
MSEQVSEFKKSLDKALENEGELLSSSTLDVLEALKGVPMSHAILKATKIGTTVNSIKKKVRACTGPTGTPPVLTSA